MCVLSEKSEYINKRFLCELIESQSAGTLVIFNESARSASNPPESVTVYMIEETSSALNDNQES